MRLLAIVVCLFWLNNGYAQRLTNVDDCSAVRLFFGDSLVKKQLHHFYFDKIININNDLNICKSIEIDGVDYPITYLDKLDTIDFNTVEIKVSKVSSNIFHIYVELGEQAIYYEFKRKKRKYSVRILSVDNLD